ncbi:hypothetical protein [Nocardia sp. NPDC049707]|uniref:hypothetical protein n=1 Tax=Nocardia sp. NPDC049707 TaxID=3154735 RepID=UPI0034474544
MPTAQALDRCGLLPQLLAVQEDALARFHRFLRGTGKSMPVRASGHRPVVGHFAGIIIDPNQVDFEDPALAEVGPAGEAFLVSQQAVEAILTRRAIDLGVEIRRGVEVSGSADSPNSISPESIPRSPAARRWWR